MQSPVRFFILITTIVIFAACNTPAGHLFNNRSPRETYLDKLEKADLKNTALGRAWIAAGENALTNAVEINIPYKETGYFAAERPAAAGFRFTSSQGEKIKVSLAREGDSSFQLFLDFFRIPENGTPEKISSAEEDSLGIESDVDNNGSFLVRLQPELLRSGGYTLVINNGPSLDFPVEEKASPRVGSFFGNSRDGGARSHEGVDIFAKFRTPAIAAADGMVTRVGDNNLGGKVIFMRPRGKNYSLYYAHLDSQIAKTGQMVKAGDTLGLIGNTGNAKSTPPHLHFGIYARNGAVDPHPFIKKTITPSAVKADTASLQAYGFSRRSIAIETNRGGKKTVDANTPMRILAATSNSYRVQLPDSSFAIVAENTVTTKGTKQSIPSTDTLLLKEFPLASAPTKKLLTATEGVEILGNYHGFKLARVNDLYGWIAE